MKVEEHTTADTNPDMKVGGISGMINKLFARPGELIKVVIILIAITWLPLLVMTLVSGEFNNPGADVSFLEDFYIHVRFLIALPFMILLEKMINPAFKNYILEMKDRVEPEYLTQYNNLVNKIGKLIASHIPEVTFLVIFIYFTYTGWDDLPIFNSNRAYLVTPDGQLDPAGWYYVLVSMPIFSLLYFRWLWRWAVWAYSMFKFSKLPLILDSLHADLMAGMYFLNSISFSFSYIIIVPSLLLSAMIGMNIVYEEAVITQYALQIAAYVIILPILAYVPLLFFIPQMIKGRAFGLVRFGDLIRLHNEDYKNKWLSGKLPSDEPLLGSADHSSLADINGSYGAVFATKPVPVNLKLVVGTILVTLIPYVPLVFTYYSATEIIKSLVSTMFGS